MQIMRKIINPPPPPPNNIQRTHMMETDQLPVNTKIDERPIIYHKKKLNANKTIDNDPWNKYLKNAMDKIQHYRGKLS